MLAAIYLAIGVIGLSLAIGLCGDDGSDKRLTGILLAGFFSVACIVGSVGYLIDKAINHCPG